MLGFGSTGERPPMSFLKKLFGSGAAQEAAPSKSVEYKGFHIAATPYKDAGQYQTCGVISMEKDGERLEHKFIRADRFQSLDEALEFSLNKGRQIIDQQGERLFGPKP
jgi:hypothetical protein